MSIQPMDIETIHSGLLSIGITAGKIQVARKKLPPGDLAAEISSMLAEAEMEMKVAEAAIARELGIELCPDCWPPELTISRSENEMTCRRCERTFSEGREGIERRRFEQFGLWREAVGMTPAR